MSFAVPAIVDKIHAWVRLDAAAGMSQSPNTFDPDWAGSGRKYLEGVMSLAGAYFAVGVLLFLAIALTDALALCCGKTTQRRERATGGCRALCGAIFSPRLWFIGGVVAMLAGTSAAIAQVRAFKSTVDSTVTGLERFDSVLTNTSSVLAQQLTPQLGNLSTTLSNMYAYGQSRSAPQGVLDAIAAMQSQNAAAAAAASSVSSQLNGTTSSLHDGLYGGRLNVNNLGNQVFIGGVAALSLFLGFMLASTVTLIPTKCCAHTFYFCNAILVATVLLVFVFAGLFVAASLLLADVCVAPSPALVKVAQLANPGQGALDTVAYYTTCGGNASTPVIGAYANVLNATNGIAAAVNASVNLAALTSYDPGFTPYAQSVQLQLGAAQAAITAVAGYSSCSSLYGIYNDVITALCTTGAPAIITVWALASAAVILVTIVAIAGARLVWAHPGAVEVDDATDHRYQLSAPPATYNPGLATGTAGGYGGVSDWGARAGPAPGAAATAPKRGAW